MPQLLFRWILNALALIAVANIVPGFHIDTFFHALIAALVLGLVNALVRPILFILTLPVTIITLGFFALFINALMIWFASTMVKGFVVVGFVPAFLSAILLWLMSLFTNWFIRQTETE